MAIARGPLSGDPTPGTVAAVASATTLAVVWATGSQPTAGSKVLVYVQGAGITSANMSAVDNGTTPATFTMDASTTSGHGVAIFRADAVTLPSSGKYTVTLTSTQSAGTIVAGGIAYTGAAVGAPTASNTGGATGTAVSSGPVAPVGAGALYFGAFSDSSGLNPETITLNWAAGTQQFVETNGSSFWPSAAADSLTGAGAQTPAWTLGDSVAWGAAAVVYDVAGTVAAPSARPEIPWQFRPHAAPGEPFDPGANTWRTLPAVPPGPTLTASYLVTGDSVDQAPLTSPAFAPLPGEVVVVKAWTVAPQQFGVPSDSAGACNWQQLASAAVPGFGVAAVWAAAVGSATLPLPPPPSMAVTVPVAGAAAPHGMVVERWAGAMVAQKTGLVGYSGSIDSQQGSGAPSGNSVVPATHNSVLTWLDVDAAAADGTSRVYVFGANGGAEDGYHRVPGAYTAYSAYQYPFAKAVAEPYGLTAPTGQTWQTLAVELEQLVAPSWNPAGPYSLTFYDDFPGSALNLLKWQPGWYGTGITGPVNTLETALYSTANVTVAGGNLQLLLANVSSDGGTHPNTGALIATQGPVNAQDGLFDFQYGFLEFRANVPGSAGAVWNWPALWATGYGQWPTTGEIDVMEGLGGTAAWHVHAGTVAVPTQDGAHPPGDWSGWHTFGVAWQPGRVDIYYDGVNIATSLSTPSNLITNSPMFVIIDNTTQAATPNVFPTTLLVDWVRVWSITGPQPPPGTQTVPWQFQPHTAPGEPFAPWLPLDWAVPAVTVTATANLAGAGAVTALVTQDAGTTTSLAAAGAVSATVVITATANLAGAASVTALVTQIAPATAAGAGAVTAVVTQACTATAAAAGTVTTVVTQIVTANVTGAGALTALVTEIAGASLTAAAATGTDPVTQAVIAALAGAGAVNATALSGGSGAAALAGAGSLTAFVTLPGGASAAGAAAVTAKAVQAAVAVLAAAGSLSAPSVQAVTAALAGAGAVNATGIAVVPFTVGTLTATTAAGGTAGGTLTGSTAPGSTITAGDQRTGGPS